MLCFGVVNGIHVKKHGNQSKVMIGDIIIINSTIMTTCMSPFSNPFLDFDSMLKFLTLINMPFVSIAHAYLYEVI
jgi:hypothetical protein